MDSELVIESIKQLDGELAKITAYLENPRKDGYGFHTPLSIAGSWPDAFGHYATIVNLKLKLQAQKCKLLELLLDHKGLSQRLLEQDTFLEQTRTELENVKEQLRSAKNSRTVAEGEIIALKTEIRILKELNPPK